MVIVLCWFGIIAVLLALVPVVAISPILLYIGMLIGAQAFQTTPQTHAPAIVLGLLPHLAAWAKTLIDGALGAAGVPVTPELIEHAGRTACSTTGCEVFGRGRDPDRADPRGDRASSSSSASSRRRRPSRCAGAVLTFFGFMHGEAVGLRRDARWWRWPTLMVAGFLYACAQAELARRRHRGRARGRCRAASRRSERRGGLGRLSSTRPRRRSGSRSTAAWRPGVARFLGARRRDGGDAGGGRRSAEDELTLAPVLSFCRRRRDDDA